MRAPRRRYTAAAPKASVGEYMIALYRRRLGKPTGECVAAMARWDAPMKLHQQKDTDNATT